MAGEFAAWHTGGAAAKSTVVCTEDARRVMFAGSCSVATREQVQCYLKSGGKSLMISPAQLADGRQSVKSLWKFIEENFEDDVLLYSAGSGGIVEQASPEDATVLENTMATLAKYAVDSGCTRLISAGGETSGAITHALQYQSFYIGENIAPGVPVMSPIENPALKLVLKSGNFGAADFFLTTLKGGSRT